MTHTIRHPIDLYEVLGVPVGASDDDIKAAFRRLVKNAHPDMDGGNRAAFDRLQVAYDVLMDPERRAHYDATGEITKQQPDNANGAPLALLAQVLDAALDRVAKQNMQPKNMNIVAMMREHLEADIQSRMPKRAEGADALVKWCGLRDRFTVKDEDRDNVMAGIIAARITGLADIERRLDEADAVTRVAMEILDNHEFSFDQPPAVTMNIFVNSPFAATATSAA